MRNRKKKCLLTLALAGVLAVGSTTLTYAVSPSSRGTIVSSGGPGVPTGPATVTIENEAVPMAEPGFMEKLTEIVDEVVPLGALPSMGDLSQSGLWLMLFAGSGAGLAALELGSWKARRRNCEEEK